MAWLVLALFVGVGAARGLTLYELSIVFMAWMGGIVTALLIIANMKWSIRYTRTEDD